MRIDPTLTDWRNRELPGGLRIAYYATEFATRHPKSGRWLCTHDLETIAKAWSDDPTWGMTERKRSVLGSIQSAIYGEHFPKNAKLGKLPALTYDYSVRVGQISRRE